MLSLTTRHIENLEIAIKIAQSWYSDNVFIREVLSAHSLTLPDKSYSYRSLQSDSEATSTDYSYSTISIRQTMTDGGQEWTISKMVAPTFSLGASGGGTFGTHPWRNEGYLKLNLSLWAEPQELS